VVASQIYNPTTYNTVNINAIIAPITHGFFKKERSYPFNWANPNTINENKNGRDDTNMSDACHGKPHPLNKYNKDVPKGSSNRPCEHVSKLSAEQKETFTNKMSALQAPIK